MRKGVAYPFGSIPSVISLSREFIDRIPNPHRGDARIRRDMARGRLADYASSVPIDLHAESMMTIADLVYERVKTMPEPLAREVLDFVGFLGERGDRARRRDLAEAQTTALTAIWDSEEDGVWDDL